MTKPRIRVECDGVMAQDARVFYVDGDTETDISNCVTGVDMHLNVGDPNTAALHVILAGGRIDAEVEDLIVENLEVEFGHREVTGFAQFWRRWLPA